MSERAIRSGELARLRDRAQPPPPLLFYSSPPPHPYSLVVPLLLLAPIHGFLAFTVWFYPPPTTLQSPADPSELAPCSMQHSRRQDCRFKRGASQAPGVLWDTLIRDETSSVPLVSQSPHFFAVFVPLVSPWFSLKMYRTECAPTSFPCCMRGIRSPARSTRVCHVHCPPLVISLVI